MKKCLMQKLTIRALKAYFEKVYPDLDFERVYASDMKKMISWFRILDKNKIDIKPKSPEETGEASADNPKAQSPYPFIKKQLT